MKSIDLSPDGGFPWFDDYFAYLQTGWTECLLAMAASAGSGPYSFVGASISSVLVSGTTYTFTITAGFIFCQGQLIRVPGNSVNINTSINSPYISLIATSATTAVPYYNGSTPSVINDITAVLVSETTGTADTSVLFAASELKPYGVALGLNNRPAWSTIAVATASGSGGVTGTINYKKDALANTLAMRFLLLVGDPYNLTASPASTFYLMGALPTGFYNTVADMDFVCSVEAVDGANNNVQDDAGVQWIKQINGYINHTNGDILIAFVKPAVGCAIYSVQVTLIMPLY